MVSCTPDVADLLERSLRTAQQSLFQCHGAPMRDVGRSLHLAAFTAVCVGIHEATSRETDLDDLHGRLEEALRDLCTAWDERPVARARRSLADVLRYPDDESETGPEIRDLRVLYESVPGTRAAGPGGRFTYTVGRYRAYVGAVFLYSTDRRATNTWDACGQPFALERALFADLYDVPVRPSPDRDAFALVLEALSRG